MTNSRKRTIRKSDKQLGFKEAVAATPDIANAFRKGLQALGSYSNKVELASPRNCNGSVDIDSATKEKYPVDSRWDYCIAYDEEAFFAEVHSADTSNVDEVLNKLNWLNKWLASNAPSIHKLKAKGKPAYFWIQTKGVHILPNSPQYRRMIQAGIKPVARLKLG